MKTILEIRELLRPFALHLLALGLTFALGAGIGLIKVAGDPPKVSNADNWTLPVWAPYHAGPLREQMAQSPVFLQDPGKRKADKTLEAAVPAWRFTGTVRRGDQQVALIEIDKGLHVRSILPGDELPGGAKVTSVRAGELAYTDGAGEQVIKLFSSDAKTPAAAGRKN